MTNFDTKCKILSDLWFYGRWDKRFENLFHKFDLGFPLACLIWQNTFDDFVSEGMKNVIEETWVGTLFVLAKTDDVEYKTLADIAPELIEDLV